MLNGIQKKLVGLCETQPATAEGLRSLLSGSGDLECRWAVGSLAVALQLARQQAPHILVLDKGFGLQALADAIGELRQFCPETQTVILGISMSEVEALRLLQAGARGILRKTADLPTILACLRAVGEGNNWMEDCVFRESGRTEQFQRTDLTSRERQVLELVEQGMKNKEIAVELGIRPGTVKIHLKHIFEKTGVRGRYGLAISGLRQKGVAAMDTAYEAVS